MSQYWAGKHGTCLMLVEKEFEDFLERYHALHKNDEDYVDIRERVDDDGLNEVEFIPSNPNMNIIEITDLNDDFTDGKFFVPFVVNGKFNVYNPSDRDAFVSKSSRVECWYVLFAEHEMDSAEVFIKNPYPTYDDLKAEFVEKMNDYLPDDFTWDEHIGSLSYAAYA